MAWAAWNQAVVRMKDNSKVCRSYQLPFEDCMYNIGAVRPAPGDIEIMWLTPDHFNRTAIILWLHDNRSAIVMMPQIPSLWAHTITSRVFGVGQLYLSVLTAASSVNVDVHHLWWPYTIYVPPLFRRPFCATGPMEKVYCIPVTTWFIEQMETIYLQWCQVFPAL